MYATLHAWIRRRSGRTAVLLPVLLMPLLMLSRATWAQEASGALPAQAVILQYHHVDSRTPPSTSLDSETFRTHMHYLRDNGFAVLRLEEVVDALRTGASLPDRSAVITFDDAYVSVYDTALPILAELDFPFTVFVTAGLVGSNNRLYATWEQLRMLGDAGATLANHTMTHPYLLERLPGEAAASWLERVRHEIEDAEALIAAETGHNFRLLAYPYGEYNPEIQQLVETLGYIGIGQHSGPISAASDFTALPRFPFSGIFASMNTFPTKVDSLAFDVRVTEPASPVTASPTPFAVLDFNADYRFDALNCFNNNEPMQVRALNAAEGIYRVETTVENRSRRFRYNCTAPGPGGRFFWYSIPWVNPTVKETGGE